MVCSTPSLDIMVGCGLITLGTFPLYQKRNSNLCWIRQTGLSELNPAHVLGLLHYSGEGEANLLPHTRAIAALVDLLNMSTS